jgi:hypothetical protein
MLPKLHASFDMSALLEAQRFAASIASSMSRVGDIEPARYGVVFTERRTEAAWLRFMAKAGAIAANESVGPEAVIELAEDADALSTAASPESRWWLCFCARVRRCRHGREGLPRARCAPLAAPTRVRREDARCAAPFEGA